MLTAIFIQMTCNIFQQRVNEAFSMYCDDEDREKPFVFNKEQVEGRRFFFPAPERNARKKVSDWRMHFTLCYNKSKSSYP